MEELNIQDFRDFVEELKCYDDEQLNVIIKTCINSLWIMYEQGYDLPAKTLIEIKKHL